MKPSEIINKIKSTLPDGIRLVAISKYHSSDKILEAYNSGQRIFGESHVQELEQKHALLPPDIQWHFIGHLQTNKVKYIAPYISLIHSIDSPRLLAEVNKQGERCQRVIPVLLQLHIAQEETKFGFTTDECWKFLEEGEWKKMKNVQICGLMCMASNVDDDKQIAKEFDLAHSFFTKVKSTFFPLDSSFDQCSWGMSDDYPIAIQHGSNMIRIGSMIFGPREY